MNGARGTSGRERVAAALDRSGPAAYPLDLCGSTVTGAASGVLARILEARGLPREASVVDTVQGISAPPPAVLAALGSDTIRVGIDRIRGPASRNADGSLEARDDFGVLWRKGPGELYFSQAGRPLGEGSLAEALEGYAFPEPDGARLAEAVARGRADAEALGLFPVLDRDCAGLFEMSARLRGTERLYLDLYDDPDGVARLADALLGYKLRYWDLLAGLWAASGPGPAARSRGAAPGPDPAPGPGPAGPGCPRAEVAIAEADDYGSDISLLIAPATLREVYIARYATLFARIKARLPGARVVFHSCGAVRDIVPDLIDAGVDALNPVQYTAAGMDAAALARDFGPRLSFWGGSVDTKLVLPRGSPAEVRAETLRASRALGAGGGLVCAAVHNIQEDVPTENALAFLDAVAELRAGGAA